MKIYILIITILIPLNLFSQIHGLVLNKETDQLVPFSNIWIENELIGTTSDYDGNFEFNDSLVNRTIIISAIGYENQRFILTENSNRILLAPKLYAIEEVVIKPVEQKEREIGIFKEKKIEHYYSCGAKPWIAARYYPNNEEYAETPFLRQIEIMTMSYSDSAIFGLRFLSVNEKGEPSDDLLSEFIIVKPKKGYSKTTIDLTEYYLKFPEKGFFIATEFYVLDKNLYEIERISRKTKEKIKVQNYGPLIGNILEKDYKNSWIYVYGEWRKPSRINSSKKKYKNKYWNLAITVKLSN